MPGTYLTKTGAAKLEQTLKDLKTQKRRLSAEVGKALEFGDLRENAEYHAAKERLQQVLQKIGDLEAKLSHVEIINSNCLVDGLVTLGTQVSVKDLGTGAQEAYILVGPDESDPAARKISIQSPLGKAFLGRKVKEKVDVSLPGGLAHYQILSIQPFE